MTEDKAQESAAPAWKLQKANDALDAYQARVAEWADLKEDAKALAGPFKGSHGSVDLHEISLMVAIEGCERPGLHMLSEAGLIAVRRHVQQALAITINGAVRDAAEECRKAHADLRAAVEAAASIDETSFRY